MKISITQDALGRLVLRCSYDAALVAAIKQRIGYAHRSFDPATKAWVFDPAARDVLSELVCEFDPTCQMPRPVGANGTASETVLDLYYLGQAKERPDGSTSAFGWIHNGWNALFPLGVLQGWFGVATVPQGSHYSVLGITQLASASDIKSAYRRLARQWHPDVCQEADAADVFKRVAVAYTVLTENRKRYDAGLTFAALAKTDNGPSRYGWRSPLRCGRLKVLARTGLRIAVERILSWADMTNAEGCVLVSSWPKGAEHFQMDWISDYQVAE